MAEDPRRYPNLKPFEKGCAPGPGAGRRKLPEAVAELLRDATPKAAKVIIDALDATRAVTYWVGKDQQAIEHVPDFDTQLKAAQALMDRMYGKPTQAITGENGEPLRVDIAGIAGTLKRLSGE